MYDINDHTISIFEINVNLPDKEQEQELVQDFYDFFPYNNLMPLFTDEHRTSNISVSWSDLRGVVNQRGAWVKTLKEFSDVLAIANTNKSYQDAVFSVIEGVTTFNQLMGRMREVIKFFQSVFLEHLFNFWNIVFYEQVV